jgi:uncharacterized protein YkwD
MALRTVRILVTLGAAAAALATSGTPASAATSCPGADAAPMVIGAERTAAALGCLVNHERQAAGLGPITIEAHAAQAALGHAADMAARNFFDHTNPDGVTFDQRVTNAGLNWTAVGENIARGQDTARQVMAAWLNSPKHCENLMNPTYTVAGYGIVTGVAGPWWVQDFARPMGVPAPPAVNAPCPRTPAVPQPAGALDGPPDDSMFAAPAAPAPAPAPAPTPAVDPEDEAIPVPATPVRLVATARRSGRTLRLRVVIPRTSASPARVAVRVTQTRGTARSLTTRWAPGRAHTLKVKLAKAADGRAVVRVAGRTATARFR